MYDMTSDKLTIQTYDQSADQLANYFAGYGSRVEDIETAIALTHKDPKIISAIEIGCGDGRDAAEIVKRVKWYEGFDPSAGLLDLAKRKSLEANFRLADALSYDYPPDIDLCFAFASLLHVNRADLAKVFAKVHTSLRENGIFYISLKERSHYQEELQEDKFGKRMFYYYNPEVVQQIAGTAFKTVFEDRQLQGATDWFTIALEKQ
jgi:SAM-dependent methyltransferase